MNKLYYISYYKDAGSQSSRDAVPAAVNKMRFITDVLKGIGCDVEILSLSGTKNRSDFYKKYPAFTENTDGTCVRFFDRYASSFKPLRYLLRKYSELKIKKAIVNTIGNDDKVILYHSLGALYLIKAFRRRHIPFILEAEEVYSDVTGDVRRRAKELKLMRMADGYLFPTAILGSLINADGKPEAIIHGVYRNERRLAETKFGAADGEGRIHCVYAGTFDPRKGGSGAAVLAAAELDRRYHVHIIGFGTERDTAKLRELIDRVSETTEAMVTYDGLKTGDEYLRFIQSCDIGLSTQDPSAAFNETSFPSKILSYLSNGLEVVSIRIPAVENSAVGRYVHYYDSQTPEAIADAIRSVDITKPSDPGKLLDSLSEEFGNDLKKLLESVR